MNILKNKISISRNNGENLLRIRGGPYFQNPKALSSSLIRKMLIVKATPLLPLVKVILRQGKGQAEGIITNNLALTSR